MNFVMLVTMLCLGPLVDRFGKKPPLAGGSLLVAGALVLLANAATYQALLATAVLLGAGGGALNSTTNTLIADLHTGPRHKNAALNLLGVFFGFGALLLPFTIGSLLEALGLAPILYLAAGLSLVLAAVFFALAFPPPKRAAGLPLDETLRLARHPLVLLFGFLLFFQSGNEFIVGGYTTSYLTRELGSSISSASYLLAAFWGATMLARVFLSRLLLRINGPRLVMLSALGSALGITVLLLAPTLTVAPLGVVLIGLGFAGIFPTALGLAGARFEEHSGTVFGILFAIALTGGMTLPWVVGQLAQAHGLRLALFLAAGNSLMIFALQLVIVRTESRAPSVSC
jgi:FHS family glucose/mannose:H+ symporter-like MFS transporter